jgi:hypothetical protein
LISTPRREATVSRLEVFGTRSGNNLAPWGPDFSRNTLSTADPSLKANILKTRGFEGARFLADAPGPGESSRSKAFDASLRQDLRGGAITP